MIKNRTCQHCNKFFENIDGKVFSNHVKWCEKNPNSPKNKKIICEKCGSELTQMLFKHHTCEQETCLQCNKIFNKNAHRNKFCSQQCSANYNNNKRKENKWKTPLIGKKYDIIEKNCVSCGNVFELPKNQNGKILCKHCRNLSQIITSKNKVLFITKIPTICEICFSEFHYKKGNNPPKTCSSECRRKYMSKIAKSNPNCGGETNFKKYKYNGITMDSSWEVIIAELMDMLSIKWTRSKKLVLWWIDKDNNKRRYHPDFYLPEYDIYLDTKNKFLMIQDADKIERVKKNNKVNLIVNDVKIIENYILNLCCPN